MPGRTRGSGIAGTAGRCRFRLSGGRRRGAPALAAAALLLVAGCSGPPAPGDPESSRAEAPAQTEDPALGVACAQFWGDPDYRDPLSRTVLDRAGTAPRSGPADPAFYALTGEEVQRTFEQAPDAAQEAAGELAAWFESEPERGEDADRAAFRDAWEALARSCAESSIGAAWALGPGEDGTKPAALVCAGIFDTPSTLTVFANANVLTSNMFALVGLGPRAVPADRSEDIDATDELLAAEIRHVDDDDVRAALEQVRAPVQEAREGADWSPGLREPLTALGAACDAAGYPAPDPAPLDADTEET